MAKATTAKKTDISAAKKLAAQLIQITAAGVKRPSNNPSVPAAMIDGITLIQHHLNLSKN